MAGSRSRRWPIGWRGIAVILALIAFFSLLRGISTLGVEPVQAGFYTDKLVLVGDTDHYQLSELDSKIISEHADSVQAGALSVRPRVLGECAAAGWTTIGAGRRAGVDGLCSPEVNGSGDSARVADWDARVKAAAQHEGDAQLGTLASLSDQCIQAVGPGAALTAARPDGSLDKYLTAEEFQAGGYALDCPLTIVDVPNSDAVIEQLADREDVTLIVAGVGHDPSVSVPDPRALQVIYRLSTTFPGLMTSAATRREGLVTITDLSRTLASFLIGGQQLPIGTPMDGSPIEVLPQDMSVELVEDQLQMIDNLSQVAPIGYVVGGVIGLLLAVGLVIFTGLRRWTAVRVALAGLGVLLASLIMTGAFPWAGQDNPAAALIFSLVFWLVALTILTLAGTAIMKVPLPVVAAGLTMAALTIDAALGAVMQPRSLLNSQPAAGLRWYGFGNSTFGAYAAAGLFVAGYLADRFLRSGHRWAASIAVLAIGGLVICCQGWPSMGADFGGVISLTPGVLFLALAVSELRVTWQRLVIIGAAAVLAVAAVSVLDWTRGPGQRSHLGDFVQRVVDGDAISIIVRKAAASFGTLISPLGLIGIVLGVAIWWVIFGRVRFAISQEQYATYTETAIAALATGVIGTLLNDAGISVFMTVSGAFAVYTAGLLFEPCQLLGWAGLRRSMVPPAADRTAEKATSG